MASIPKAVSSKTVYKNQFVEVKVDTLEFNNRTWEQAYFVKPNKNGVGIVAMDAEGIYLVNQYRYAARQYLWQIPMGMIDQVSDEVQTATHELQEEAGLTAKKFVKIGSLISEPGMSDQKTFIYVAQELKQVESSPSETEVGMRAKHVSFAQINEMIKGGEIICGFTLSALLLLKNNFFSF